MLLYQLGPVIARCFYSVEGLFIHSLKQRDSVKRYISSEAGIGKHMYATSGKDSFGCIFSRAEYRITTLNIEYNWMIEYSRSWMTITCSAIS